MSWVNGKNCICIFIYFTKIYQFFSFYLLLATFWHFYVHKVEHDIKLCSLGNQKGFWWRKKINFILIYLCHGYDQIILINSVKITSYSEKQIFFNKIFKFSLLKLFYLVYQCLILKHLSATFIYQYQNYFIKC